MQAREVKLKEIITQPRDIIKYLYDFGDGWSHQIEVEEFLMLNAATKYPTCIDGQMNCPPEDCGGIHSFYHCMDVLKDKKHPEYKETARWFRKKYDAELFDKDKVNKQLSKLDRYINKWLSGS